MGAKALNSDSFSGAGGHAGGYQIDLLVQGYPGKSVCHGSLGWSFLDGISMVVLTISVLLPTIQAAGLDLIWFGVFIVLVVEVAQITPPVGLNLFVLQGLTKRDIGYIAGTVLPMFAIMMLAIVLIYFFPGIVLWLPSLM